MNITNTVIQEYIDNFYENENEVLRELRVYAKEQHVPIILKSSEDLLFTLLKLKRPAKVLEIGTAVGYSSCFFTDCCGCDVITIELEDDMADKAEENIRRMGFENKIKVLRGEAQKVLDTDDVINGGPYDMVFIDAAKSYYRTFWDKSIPMLNDGAVIICDNVLQKGMTAADEFDTRKRYKTSVRHMRNFLNYIKDIEYADTVILPVGDGMSISIIDKNIIQDIKIQED